MKIKIVIYIITLQRNNQNIIGYNARTMCHTTVHILHCEVSHITFKAPFRFCFQSAITLKTSVYTKNVMYIGHRAHADMDIRTFLQFG